MLADNVSFFLFFCSETVYNYSCSGKRDCQVNHSLHRRPSKSPPIYMIIISSSLPRP